MRTISAAVVGKQGTHVEGNAHGYPLALVFVHDHVAVRTHARHAQPGVAIHEARANVFRITIIALAWLLRRSADAPGRVGRAVVWSAADEHAIRRLALLPSAVGVGACVGPAIDKPRTEATASV
jgi:hypothetical protein